MKRALLAVALLLHVSPALPHSSPLGMPYPSDCCSSDGKECAPVPWSSIRGTKEGYMVVVPKGAHHHTMEKQSYPRVFRYWSQKIKKSTDGMYHACIGSTGYVHCIIIPPEGF